MEIYEAIFSLRQTLVLSRDVQKRKTSESDTKPPDAKRGRWATSTVSTGFGERAMGSNVILGS